MSDYMDRARPAMLFAAGALLGAATALLLAPKSGKETRREIRRVGRDALKSADRFREDLGESIKDLIEDIGSSGKNALDAGREFTGKAREELMEALESGRKFLEDEKKRLEKALLR